MPTLLLVGNHDMPGMAVKANSLDIFRALDVPGVIVGYKDDARVVETRSGPVFLAWMPYPMRNRLMAWTKYQGKSIEELNQGLRSEVSERLRSLAEQAEQHDMPRVLAGHFTVEAASFGSERSVMLGSRPADPEVDGGGSCLGLRRAGSSAQASGRERRRTPGGRLQRFAGADRFRGAG